MTNEEQKAAIAAMIREREQCVVLKREDRLVEIDRCLRQLGHGAKAPAKRAEKRKK